MITFFNDSHQAHAPVFEFFRGERVPCFETPARAEYIKTRLTERGHLLRAPQTDSRAALAVLPSRSPTTKSACFSPGKSVAWLEATAGMEWQLM